MIGKLWILTLLTRYIALAEELQNFVVTENHCITNSSSALSFISDVDDTFDTGSQLFPKSPTYLNIDCNIGETYCTPFWASGVWKLQNSIDGKINLPIKDWRWEGLTTIKTKYVDDDGEDLNFYEAIQLTKKNDFRIPFSFRAKQDGHIFLCDGDSVSGSSCYWVMLKAWEGTRSVFRRCEKGQISPKQGKWPKPPCKDILADKNHTKKEVITSEKLWSHFEIVKHANTITVKRGDTVLLKYEDPSPLSPNHVFFHSKAVNGLWKLHTYQYLYCDEETTQQLGSTIQATRGSNCISMFIITCASCRLTFEIRCEQRMAKDYTFSTEDEKWREIKMQFNCNEMYCNCGLFVTTAASYSGMFWAIDDIRQCSAEEYRYIKSTKSNLPCQLIEVDEVIKADSGQASELELNCPESAFGTSCIPCKIIAGNEFCSDLKYCEWSGKGKTTCRCSAGYRNPKCQTDCPEWKYGHGCKKSCGECRKTCDVVNGYCPVCRKGYQGDRCDIPPEGILIHPPNISSVSPTSFNVTVSNFEISGRQKYPRYYKVQYREKRDNNKTSWKDAGADFEFQKSVQLMVDNLSPSTEYCVRALVYSDPNIIPETDAVNMSCFWTTCIPIETRDIITEPSNTSVIVKLKLRGEVNKVRYHVNWQANVLIGVLKSDTASDSHPNLPWKSCLNTDVCRVNVDSCQPQDYTYSINIDGYPETDIRNGSFKIEPLQPCQMYELTLRSKYLPNNMIIYFHTTVGVPPRVINLREKFKSSKEIVLTWDPPKTECQITDYNVRYKLIRPVACASYKPSGSERTVNNVINDEVQLSDLQPYSLYEINVAALSDGLSGEDASLQAQTAVEDNLVDDEIPYILDVTAINDYVSLSLTEIDCSKMRGPIYLNIQLKCLEEWCSTKKRNKTVEYNPSRSISFYNLFPYANYTISMKVSRSKTDWDNAGLEQRREIMTDPSVPNKIGEVSVISKDENSISLRWKPPYPPTGILKMYNVRYSTRNSIRSWNYDETVHVTNCRLWPSYHCATITEGVKRDWKYHIQIWATNETPRQYVEVSQNVISVTAGTGVPSVPYNLSVDWTANNILRVSWNHPNNTNGVLKEFEITIKDGSKQKYLQSLNIGSEEDYMAIYFLEINGTKLESCSSYTLTITAHNENFKGYPATTTDWIPPPTPSVSKLTRQPTSTNHTITIMIPRPRNSFDAGKVYMLIAESTYEEAVLDELKQLEESLRTLGPPLEMRHSRLLLNASQSDLPFEFEIGGNATTDNSKRKTFPNPPLESGNKYIISLVYVNDCLGMTRLYTMTVNASTVGDAEQGEEETSPEWGDGTVDDNSGLYVLLLLIFLIPLAVFMYMKTKKQSPPDKVNRFIAHSKEDNTDTVPLTEIPPKVNPIKPIVSPRPENAPYTFKTTHSKPIKINEYEAYVMEAIQNGELERQHGLFPRGQTQPWEYGALMVNKSKNRYNNLIAYDHTRVKLRKLAGVEYSDYINANYIDGYRTPRAYIATQGPKVSTLNDFWRMIWQQKTKNIVMLANIYEGRKKKVERYWPEINEDRDFNGIRVQYVSSQVFADYEYRVFNVYNNGEQRKVEQLHFTSWPDHGIPLYSQSLVPFLQKMLTIPNSSNSPVVIHCSAGVGRTGTIILCDICLRMAAGEGSVDFLAHLEHLRSQRPNMVDNIEQYKLAHLVVLECLVGMRTAVLCNEDMTTTVQNLIDGGGIRNQMRYLQDTRWQDEAMDTVWEQTEEVPVYPGKNRFEDITPDQQHRVFLARYPASDEQSSYINAIQVDGFRNPGRFIVTQQPMPSTLGDFWRLVHERGSTVVVSLNEINPNDETCCEFWPDEGKEIRPVDYLTIRHSDSILLEYGLIVTVHLIDTKENTQMAVKIVSMKSWMPNDLLPNNTEMFLSFWEESYALSRQSDPVIITCYDGATASGLYIAMSFVIEKMKLEHDCDVCLAVRSIRRNRKQFVTSEEQFEFLYNASVKYINGFQSYSNFA